MSVDKLNEIRREQGIPDEVWEKIVPFVSALVDLLETSRGTMSNREYRKFLAWATDTLRELRAGVVVDGGGLDQPPPPPPRPLREERA